MEEKPVNRQPCIPTLKAMIAARRRFFAPHHHFLATLALAAVLLLPGQARAQINGDAPYPPAAAEASGQMQQDDQVLVHDRAVLAHDRAANPSRVPEDEAQYRSDMAAYHRDSNQTADHMNGQQVNTTYTSRTVVPLQ